MSGAVRDDASGAPERTLLAWSRTAVTAFTLGAVALRLLPNERGEAWGVAFVAWSIAVAAEVYGYRAYRSAPPAAARRRAVFSFAVANSLLAAGVLLAVVA